MTAMSMPIDVEKCKKLIGFLNKKNLDFDEGYVKLLDMFIGVDAPDAKNWYGSGENPLRSIDFALNFCKRIASPAVMSRYGQEIDFKLVWATCTAMEMSRLYDAKLIPIHMIITVIQTNIIEQEKAMIEKEYFKPTLN